MPLRSKLSCRRHAGARGVAAGGKALEVILKQKEKKPRAPKRKEGSSGDLVL